MVAERLNTTAAVEDRRAKYGPLLCPTGTVRAVIFLTITLLAYAASNAFTYYLDSGAWFSVDVAGFERSIAQTLGSTMLEPISIFSHPWLIVIRGLLLSAMIAVPLLVACLYHSRYCTLFLLCVAILAHAPVMALVLGVGCMLVAMTPLRRRNPSLAILLGMLPMWVYLIFSTRNLPFALLPKQRLMLAVPLLTAAIGAIVAVGLVLIIAHYARYRPGVIWPVMAVLLAVPAWLFFSHIGTDELEFSLLAQRLSPAGTAFVDEALESQDRHPGRSPDKPVVEKAQRTLERRKANSVVACDDFIQHHPSSPRMAAVLWIKGTIEDTQLCVPALYAGLVQHYDDFPLPQSRSTWEQLASGFAGDARAAAACYRLAHLDLRDGQPAAAAANLEQASKIIEKTCINQLSATPKSWWADVFSSDPGPPTCDYFARLSGDVARLQLLIQANGILQDANAAAACAALISVDSRHVIESDFDEQMAELAKRYDETKLADNIDLARAMGKSNLIERARLLRNLEDQPGSDASIEANYRLAELAMKVEVIPALGRYLEKPEVYLRRVLAAVKNPWQPLAARELARLTATTQSAATRP